jgi:hypothetical protein
MFITVVLKGTPRGMSGWTDRRNIANHQGEEDWGLFSQARPSVAALNRYFLLL